MAKIVVSLACSLLLVSSAVCASDMNATEFQSPSQTPGTESASALASSTQSDPSGHNATATTSTIIMDALAASSKRMTTFTAISGTTSETLTETFYTTKPATSVSNSGDEIASLGSHLGSTDGTGRTTMLLVNILTNAQTAQATQITGQPVSEFDYVESSSQDLSRDLNETDLLSGWHWYPMEWPWYLILQTISSIVGIIGNLLVMLVLFERRSACRSTDTLIGGLAVADFLTSIFIIPIPNERYIPTSWLAEVYCKLIHSSFFLWVSVNASTYILMAISIERYIAVAYPLYFCHSITRRRISFVITFIWILAVASTAFGFFLEMVDDATHTCTFRLLSPRANLIIGYYWFLVRMVIPMLTMLIPQTLIAIELHRQSTRFKEDKNITTRRSRHLIARNRVLKMMFEVILIYIICWAPNQIAYLGYVLGFVPPTYLGSALHHALTILGFCNSCANPFIYTARHPQFRAAIMSICTCKKGSNTPLFEPKMDSNTSRSGGRPDEVSTVKTV